MRMSETRIWLERMMVLGKLRISDMAVAPSNLSSQPNLDGFARKERRQGANKHMETCETWYRFKQRLMTMALLWYHYIRVIQYEANNEGKTSLTNRATCQEYRQLSIPEFARFEVLKALLLKTSFHCTHHIWTEKKHDVEKLRLMPFMLNAAVLQ